MGREDKQVNEGARLGWPDAGMLLVASPELLDPNFTDTVVLILDVSDDFVLGVVLNRPSVVPVSEVIERWEPVISEPDVLFSGGPVSLDSALATVTVGDHDHPPPGFRPVFGSMGIIDLDAPVEAVLPVLSGMRVYVGYAGWTISQLQGEVDRGDWYVLPSQVGDWFRADTATLWRDVLARQPGMLAWHATRPADPDLN